MRMYQLKKKPEDIFPGFLNYELQITNYKLQVTSYKLQVKVRLIITSDIPSCVFHLAFDIANNNQLNIDN